MATRDRRPKAIMRKHPYTGKIAAFPNTRNYRRKIGNKPYYSWGRLSNLHNTKSKAKRKAKGDRKRGFLVRIIPIKGGYATIGRGGRKKKVRGKK